MTTSATTRALLVSSRPISWINTAFPFAAAYLMTTRHLDIALVAGAVFFLIPYNLLMYGINDVFDYESDLRNPRKGGVEGALLDPRVHRATIIASVVTTVPAVSTHPTKAVKPAVRATAANSPFVRFIFRLLSYHTASRLLGP